MKLTRLPLGKAPSKAQIRHLYATAFPKEEQMPWYLLRLLSLRRGMGVAGYYADGRFCGMTFSAATDKVLFVLFLAVEADVRGQGYGSAILEALRRSHPEHTILLNVELLDPQADNYAQRVQRMHFYKKNGFYDTGYDIDEVGGTFRVLSTAPRLCVADYLQVFGKISYGFWKPYIREGEMYDQRTDA